MSWPAGLLVGVVLLDVEVAGRLVAVSLDVVVGSVASNFHSEGLASRVLLVFHVELDLVDEEVVQNRAEGHFVVVHGDVLTGGIPHDSAVVALGVVRHVGVELGQRGEVVPVVQVVLLEYDQVVRDRFVGSLSWPR